MRRAIVLTPADNVATAVSAIERGEVVEVAVGEAICQFTMQEPIPFGHKFAVCQIKKGDDVIKYGETIGVASTDIAPGTCVHVHNVESQRGRGDLSKQEAEK